MGGNTAGIATVIRARDRVGAVCVTDGASGAYLVTIAGVLLVASYPTGAHLAQAMVASAAAASLTVEGIDPHRLFTATPREMQRRATVAAAMTETARRHG